MAGAKKCDRCGKYYTIDDKKFKVNGKLLGYIDLVSPSDYYVLARKHSDLCDDCARDLWHWLCNEKEAETMVNNEDIVDYIAANSTLSKTAIRDVLDLEMQYLEDIGVAEESEE